MKTKSEMALLVILVVIALLIGNYFGYTWYAKQISALTLTEKRLKGDIADAEFDLRNKADLEKKKAWIEAHEPPLGERDITSAQVLDDVKKGTTEQHLEIMEQNLKGTENRPGGTRVNVHLKLKGSMQGICKWLADLQKPEDFYAVTELTMLADQDQKSIICTMELARYFKEGSK